MKPERRDGAGRQPDPAEASLSLSVPVCLWGAEEDLTWTAASPEARYTDIILYASGSLAMALLLLLAGLYRRQVLHGRHARQPATVQKLSRFPLARQVPCPVPSPVPPPLLLPESAPPAQPPALQFSLESGSSGKSSSSLVRGVRLSSSGPPLLAGLVNLDLPLDPLWEFPRDRYTEQRGHGARGSAQAAARV